MYSLGHKFISLTFIDGKDDRNRLHAIDQEKIYIQNIVPGGKTIQYIVNCLYSIFIFKTEMKTKQFVNKVCKIQI